MEAAEGGEETTRRTNGCTQSRAYEEQKIHKNAHTFLILSGFSASVQLVSHCAPSVPSKWGEQRAVLSRCMQSPRLMPFSNMCHPERGGEFTPEPNSFNPALWNPWNSFTYRASLSVLRDPRGAHMGHAGRLNQISCKPTAK